jgi:MFS family permease
LHVKRVGLAPGTYGALLSLNGALVVSCELMLITFTQRFTARHAMAAGYLLIGAGFAFNAVARSGTALAIAMAVFTLGEMVAMPISSAYIADLAPPNLRGRYMGVFGFIWALALIIGPALGMMLYERNASLLWLGCGALGLLAAAVILWPVKVAGGAKLQSRLAS